MLLVKLYAICETVQDSEERIEKINFDHQRHSLGSHCAENYFLKYNWFLKAILEISKLCKAVEKKVKKNRKRIFPDYFIAQKLKFIWKLNELILWNVLKAILYNEVIV